MKNIIIAVLGIALPLTAFADLRCNVSSFGNSGLEDMVVVENQGIPVGLTYLQPVGYSRGMANRREALEPRVGTQYITPSRFEGDSQFLFDARTRTLTLIEMGVTPSDYYRGSCE
jgi:hypothetical protein